MSEIPDISEAETIPAVVAVPPGNGAQMAEARTIPAAFSSATDDPEAPMDFGPLIDEEDDGGITPMPPLRRTRRRRSRWLMAGIILLLLVLLGGGALVFFRSSQATPVQYTQAAATVGNLAVTVSGSGPITPNAVYNLNFSASAPISAIYVKVGDRVTQGQKLAQLDSTTLQDSVNQAQASLNSARTSLAQAQTNLNNVKNQQSTTLSIAKLNEQKALAACVPPTSSTPVTGTPDTQATATAESTCEQLARQQYTQAQQQANAAISNATNQVTSAQQQVNNAQTSLNTARDNLKNATLLAPHDGLIEAVNGLVGEAVNGGNSSANSNGTSSSSAFIVLIDDSSLSIQASVSEADIASIQVNQPVTFTVAAYPSKTFRASVASVDTMGTTSSSVVTYTVDLAVDMQSVNGANIYSGMTATASITTAERIGTLLVPSAALTFSTTALTNGEITRSQLSSLVSGGGTTGTGGGSRGIVIELKAGKLVPVLVTTGLTNGQETEILSGLREGDEVVVGQTGGSTSSSSSSSGGSNGGSGRFNGGGGFGGGTGGFGGGSRGGSSRGGN